VDVRGKSGASWRRLAGGLFVTLTASFISAAAALAVVPDVPVPEVEVPEVEVPALPVPSVPVPSVEVPSPPAAQPTTPSTPAGSGGVRVPSPSGYGGSSGSRIGGAVAHAPGAGSDWGGSIPGESGTAGTSEQRRAVQRQRRARERGFRRKVRRMAPCFYALSQFEGRVLALRAGLRGARPHSRGYVARRLDVTGRRVQRTERRGLRKLRRTDASDRCAFASGRRHHGVDVAVRILVGAPVADAVVFAATGESRGADRGEVAGAQASSDPQAAGIAVPLIASGEGEYGSGGVPIWALLVAAALLLTAAILAAQRRRPPPAAVAGTPITEAQARAERRAERVRARAAAELERGRADEESIADVAIPPPPWERHAKPSGSADHGRPRRLGSILSRRRR
jgi:hypothetical protein